MSSMWSSSMLSSLPITVFQSGCSNLTIIRYFLLCLISRWSFRGSDFQEGALVKKRSNMVKSGHKLIFFQKPILFLENFPHTEVQLLSLTYPKFKPAESDEANAVNFKILRGVSPQANVNSVLGLLKPWYFLPKYPQELRLIFNLYGEKMLMQMNEWGCKKVYQGGRCRRLMIFFWPQKVIAELNVGVFTSFDIMNEWMTLLGHLTFHSQKSLIIYALVVIVWQCWFRAHF